MRINLGRNAHHSGSRSYLDSAADIVGLPMHELMRMAGAAQRHPWSEDCPPEQVPELLNRLYGLATQI